MSMPGMEAAPARAERARDRAAHRPDEAGGARRRRRRVPDVDPASDARIFASIAALAAEIACDSLTAACSCVRAARSASDLPDRAFESFDWLVEQLVVDDRHLLEARVDDVRLVADALAHLHRPLARDDDVVLRSRDLRGDLLVLVRDEPEVVELVDDVLEALRLQHELERARVRLLVDRDEPACEPCCDERVLVLQEPHSRRLDAIERIERVEARGGARGRRAAPTASRRRCSRDLRASGSAS